MADPGDDFYIGYRPRTSPRIARRVRVTLAGLGVLVVASSLVLVAAQAGFSDAIFEWTRPRTFEGTLRTHPYPRLEVPDLAGESTSHLLVGPGKFGLDVPAVTYDGRKARITGELIQSGGRPMIQARPDDVELLPGAGASLAVARALGRWILVGEILDSKCYLGVMKPGRGKPHRSCAVRCISGGVPPMLLVTDGAGEQRHLLLTGSDGRPLGEEVLAVVAEPVEVDGDVVVIADLWYLRTEPDAIRRLGG